MKRESYREKSLNFNFWIAVNFPFTLEKCMNSYNSDVKNFFKINIVNSLSDYIIKNRFPNIMRIISHKINSKNISETNLKGFKAVINSSITSLSDKRNKKVKKAEKSDLCLCKRKDNNNLKNAILYKDYHVLDQPITYYSLSDSLFLNYAKNKTIRGISNSKVGISSNKKKKLKKIEV